MATPYFTDWSLIFNFWSAKLVDTSQFHFLDFQFLHFSASMYKSIKIKVGLVWFGLVDLIKYRQQHLLVQKNERY